jgi:hypothetical protein
MHLDIELTDHWDLVEPTGELIRRAAIVALGEGPATDQVSIASRELLENTVKYSQGDEARITLDISEQDRSVCIVVENRPDPAHIDTLKREIAHLSQLETGAILKHYVGKMAIAAKAEVGKSGLGLARIRHECGMDLTLEIVGKRVRIIAQRNA